ncbi:glycosyl transferase family protein [Pseudoruegeria sp. HB172150]|uniref:glycosyl transferase family protein n=1 Tax=Pseudoruegeria sp. HB172150 TaxID=2721164 RepID=UPI0015542041|nr:glycosyl transferase family protein [Pseudoruegeria sp. HB172150]
MTLAPYVRILGRGPGRSRSLTRDEAREALTVILKGDAAPEATGALLMLLRMKGETPDEIAGFAEAARATLPPLPRPDLDWPSYAAGRTRGLPWFLLSARLVASAGYSVLLHGWNSHQQVHASVRSALPHAGIPTALNTQDVARHLANGNIAYLPLETLSQPLLDLLQLRDHLGLRSCINTVLRVLNPGAANASVQGVFHPPYLTLQADAGHLLGLPSLTVIKGGGGEFERNPAKHASAFGLRNGTPWEDSFADLIDETRRLNDGETDPARLTALWSGALTDPFAETVVTGTAALALATLGAGNPDELATHLWTSRNRAAA